MKVIETIADDNETASVIDVLDGIEVPDRVRSKVYQAVGEFLVEKTLLSVADAKSPVRGAKWPALSKSYKEFKTKFGATPKANMELTGDMLSALGFKVVDDGIKIGVFGSEAAKADGHNNFSGQSELPLRRFLPAEGDNYKSDIQKGIQQIINDIVAESTVIDTEDLATVETRSELFNLLETSLGITGSAAITRAVLGNDRLRRQLESLDLLDLLNA